MRTFPDIVIERAIVHRINRKEELTEHATLTPSENVIQFSGDIKEMILKRISTALRNDYRTFALNLEDTSENSFFGLCQELTSVTNDEFLRRSITLGERLAQQQKSSSIPGGFFVLLQAHYGEDAKPMSIAIKAEPHEALRHITDDTGRSRIELLKSVFLSPSQKLFKIGILFEHEEVTGDEINDIYGCLVYDAQFRVENSPAEYFYKEFLGLTTIENAKIQSKRFFEKTEEFAESFGSDHFDLNGIRDALRGELMNPDTPTISPVEFANSHIPEEDTRNEYLRQVADFMPEAFPKDISLINQQLRTRKIEFENRIKIVGPEDEFNRTVEIVEQSAEQTVLRIRARRKS